MTRRAGAQRSPATAASSLMPSRRPWYAVALLTGLSGLLLGAAAVVRWRPCLVNDDSVTCAGRQDRGLDYLVPTEPWSALPATAVLAGLALLLLAAAGLLVARRVVRRPVPRALAVVALTAKPLLLGLLILAAPVVGPLPRRASPVLLVTEIVLDLAVLAVVLAAANDRLAVYQRLLVAAVAYWVTGWVGRVLDALVFGLLAPEAEVAPGAGLLTAVLLLACGGGVAGLTATAQERRLPARRSGNPLERPDDR